MHVIKALKHRHLSDEGKFKNDTLCSQQQHDLSVPPFAVLFILNVKCANSILSSSLAELKGFKKVGSAQKLYS